MSRATSVRLPPQLPPRLFTLALDQLRPGDIILTRSPGALTSKLITAVTGGTFSHAILVVALPNGIESADYGVVRFRLDRFAVSDQESILVRRPLTLLSSEAENDLTRFANKQVDKEYAEWDVLSALFSLVPKFEESRFFCSELVASSYEAAKIDLLPKKISAAKVTPQMIAVSPLLKTVDGALTERALDQLPFAPAMLDGTNPPSLNERLTEVKQRIVANVFNEFAECGYHVFDFGDVLTAVVKAFDKAQPCAAEMDLILTREMMAERIVELPRLLIPASSTDFFIDVRVRKAILMGSLSEQRSKELLNLFKKESALAEKTLAERTDDVQKTRKIYIATGLECWRLYLSALWEIHIFHQRIRQSVDGAITHLQEHLMRAQS